MVVKPLLIEIPIQVGTIVYCKRRDDWEYEKDLVPYKITNLMISCNKKGQWTKKYTAKFYDISRNKTIDRSRYFSFEDIGKSVFVADPNEYDERCI